MIDEQIDLLSPPVEPSRGVTLADRFAAFHKANPHVYEAIKRKARLLIARGRKRIGIAEIVEELRYDYRMQTEKDEWKMNNSYRAFYARLLVNEDPHLYAGVIELRIQKAKT